MTNNTPHLPVFSIVTPAYNCESTIAKCINSVHSQTINRSYYEHIVVYRKSCDATLSILREHECNLRTIEGIENGWVNASNEGLLETNGTYTLLLMADDVLCIDILEKLFGIISSIGPDIIYGDILWKLNNVYLLLHPSDPSRIREGMYLHHPGLVVKKTVYEEIGYYNSSFRYSADWEFLVRTLSSDFKWHNSNLVHCSFLYGGQSIVNIRSFIAENKRIREIYSLPKYSCLKTYIYNGFLVLAPAQFAGLFYLKNLIRALLQQD